MLSVELFPSQNYLVVIVGLESYILVKLIWLNRLALRGHFLSISSRTARESS